MKIEIKPEHLANHLSKGEVEFTFEKLDGTLRESVGTTSAEIIGVVKVKPKREVTSIPYFDIEKNQWRSVAEGQKIYIDTEWIRDVYSCPQLSDGEILFMLCENEYIPEDNWFYKLVNIIKEAPQTEIVNFRLGYRELSSTIWKWKTEESYKEELEKSWILVESIITGTYV